MIEKIKDVVLPLLVVLIIIGWGLFLTFKEIDKEDLMIFNKESDCRSNVASLTAVMSMYVADYEVIGLMSPMIMFLRSSPMLKMRISFAVPGTVLNIK